MVDLRHITIPIMPHSAILKLTCKEKKSIDFSNFLSVLSTKFLSSLVFRRLTLRGSENFDNTATDRFVLYFWTTAAIRDCLPFSQSQVQLVLIWPPSEYDHGPPTLVKALTCFFDAMNLPFLTQSQMSTSHSDMGQDFWNASLLERVRVQGYATKSFLEALVYKTKAAEKSILAYRNVSFPKLRYISLEETNFDSWYLSVDMLLDCLMERCERDAEVQALRLDGCSYISSNDVARLEEIVDVTWVRRRLGAGHLDIP